MSEPIKQDLSNILAVLKEKHGKSIHQIYIPSLKREVAFKPITVDQQKTVSKALLDSNQDQYNSLRIYCALIQSACVDDKVEISSLTDIDRIKIMFDLYRLNSYEEKMDFKCNACNANFDFKIDLKRFSEEIQNNKFFENSTDTYVISDEVNGLRYVFELSYPTVVRVLELYKDLSKDNISIKNNISDKINIDVMLYKQTEYAKLCIKGLLLETIAPTESSSAPIVVDFEKYDVAGLQKIIGELPRNIFYNEEYGLLKKIIDDYINPLTRISQDVTCPSCQKKYDGIISVQTFFLMQ